jgi:Ion transport protein/EF-hand domain pair
MSRAAAGARAGHHTPWRLGEARQRQYDEEEQARQQLERLNPINGRAFELDLHNSSAWGVVGTVDSDSDSDSDSDGVASVNVDGSRHEYARRKRGAQRQRRLARRQRQRRLELGSGEYDAMSPAPSHDIRDKVYSSEIVSLNDDDEIDENDDDDEAWSLNHPMRNKNKNTKNNNDDENDNDDDENDDDDDDDDDEIIFQWAAVLVNDALNTRSRSIGSEVQSVGASSTRALQAFKLAHNRWYRRAIFVVVFANMLLGFFESPARGVDGDVPWLTEMIEFACTLVYTFDMLLKFTYLSPRRFAKDRWNLVKLAAIVLLYADLMVSLWFRAFNLYPLRVGRYLRPFFLLEKSRRLRNIVQNIFKTIGSIMAIMAFILLFLFVWAFFGLTLFYGTAEGTQYFSTFGQSLVSLLVLLTTANYPDVMMPSYTETRAYALFFVAFLLFGLYFLLNTLIAIIYNSYREATKADVLRGLATRRRALINAFAVLDRQGVGFIDLLSWKRLLEHLRPDITEQQAVLIFNMVDRNHSGEVSLLEFVEICDYIDLEFREERDERWGVYFWDRAWHRRLNVVVKSRYFDWLVNALVLANVAVAITETYVCPQDLCSPWVYIEYAFLVAFWLEITVRWIGFGFLRYWLSGWNVFDAVTVVGWSVGLIVESAVTPSVTEARWVIMLRMLRMLRLLSTSEHFRLILDTFFALSPHMLYFLAVLLSIFYDFALLGSELFYGRLSPFNPVLQAMPYGQLGYWANNFDSLGSSLVVLFELMVVNNWNITMDAVVAVTHWSARFYFIAFYVLTVLVVLNLVIAFVIEAFVTQFELNQNADVLQSELNRLVADAQGRTPGPRTRWKLKHNMRLFRLYIDMFKAPSGTVAAAMNGGNSSGGALSPSSSSASRGYELRTIDESSSSEFDDDDDDDDDDDIARYDRRTPPTPRAGRVQLPSIMGAYDEVASFNSPAIEALYRRSQSDDRLGQHIDVGSDLADDNDGGGDDGVSTSPRRIDAHHDPLLHRSPTRVVSGIEAILSPRSRAYDIEAVAEVSTPSSSWSSSLSDAAALDIALASPPAAVAAAAVRRSTDAPLPQPRKRGLSVLTTAPGTRRQRADSYLAWKLANDKDE